jgi:purine-binding chemotaxis protein CheW
MSDAINMEASERAASGSLDATHQYVTFSLGDQQYCVDIMSVREIRASNVITALPNAPEFVRGVINLRGTIVPIIDLRTRFALGRTEPTQGHVVVIVMIGERLIGLLVDGVSDILTVRQSEVAAIPDTDGESRNSAFEGLITHRSEMLIVIALDRLLKSPPPVKAGTPILDAAAPSMSLGSTHVV